MTTDRDEAADRATLLRRRVVGYSDAVGGGGPDSGPARLIRAIYADDPEFLVFADALDRGLGRLQAEVARLSAENLALRAVLGRFRRCYLPDVPLRELASLNGERPRDAGLPGDWESIA